MHKVIRFEEVKNNKGAGNNRVIDTVFQERISSGSQKTKMTAEQNKRSDIPAHNKHPYGGPHDRITD